MTEGSFNNKLLAQVFVDGLRLCGRFHDYQSFCHRLFTCGVFPANNAAKFGCLFTVRRYHTFTKFFPGNCFTSPNISSSKSAAMISVEEVSSIFSIRSSRWIGTSTFNASIVRRPTSLNSGPRLLNKDADCPAEDASPVSP